MIHHRKKDCMHIKASLLPQALRVTIQSSTANPGPDVVYQIPKGCPDYQKLLNTLLKKMPITRDHIHSIHSRALNKASNIVVTYPKLRKIQNAVIQQQEELYYGSV